MLRRWVALPISILIIANSSISARAQSNQKQGVQIEAQALGQALNQLAEQFGSQIVINSKDAQGLQSPGIEGAYTMSEALDLMLANSKLAQRSINARTIAIFMEETEEAPPDSLNIEKPKLENISRPIQSPSTSSTQDLPKEEKWPDAVVVTAQKRTEDSQSVPLALSVLKNNRLEQNLLSGESNLALSGTVPNLYAESSSGRTAPRFYIRGLGNADFNQAASQPVSVVYDDVPLEKTGLKSFPIFDVDRIEVLRGPQGSLFGRNTTAGIVKIESRRPTSTPQGYARLSVGNFRTVNAELAYGGALNDSGLSGRISLLSQNRANWIDNDFTQVTNTIGGYSEIAGRAQLLWAPSETFSALLIAQHRRLRGNSSTAFFANAFVPGSNQLRDSFQRGVVQHDGGGDQRSEIDHSGLTLRLDKQSKNLTLTSISSAQFASRFGRADVDGGFGSLEDKRPTGPGLIPFSVDTGSDSELEQFSQEFRVTSEFSGPFNFQAGTFIFRDTLDFFDLDANEVATRSETIGISSNSFVENDAWAIFGQGRYDLSPGLRVTAGLRYTVDLKSAEFSAPESSSDFDIIQTVTPIKLSDRKLSWDLGLSKNVSDEVLFYLRLANGFRAPTIQTTIRTDPDVTTADSETVMSYEAGLKTEFANRIRLNGGVYFYEVSDIQLAAVGGDNLTGGVALQNAENGQGYGIEIDAEARLSKNLTLSFGGAYTKTKINDDNLLAGTCISCTVTDPLDSFGRARIDGNPFQHVPKWTIFGHLAYEHPLKNGDELTLDTDWRVRGPTNDFLYESAEFFSGTQFELGLKLGYTNKAHNFEISAFSQNITNELNVVGGVDFNNNTAYVNEPRSFGLMLAVGFH